MDRNFRRLLKSSSLGVIAMLGVVGAAKADAPIAGVDANVQDVHDRVLTLDTHVDISIDYATHKADPGKFSAAQVDLPKMRAGGLDAAFFIVYTPQGPLTEEGYAAAKMIAMRRLKAIQRAARAYPDEIGLALSAKDVTRIAKSGRKVALIGMENGFPLGETIEKVGWWAEQGVRYVGITHFGHNQFGDSSNPNTAAGQEEDLHVGLSDLGKELVAELNLHGIMVDVSHAGKKTMMQAIELSKAPIIASHSGVMAVSESPRNLDDEQLKALAENGGVAQMVALDAYVKALTEEQIAFQANLRKELNLDTAEGRAAATPAIFAEYQKRIKGMWEIAPRASVSDFVDHIDHAVKVAGIDHVGIASDFDGGGGIDGWENAADTYNVTAELMKRGYSEEDIAKIWSGNLLRVLADVEAVGKKLSK